MLSRGSWERSHDFVGHRAPVVAASFNPHLFRPAPKDEKDPAAGEGPAYTCVALGSQDNKVTVWLSQSSRPVLIARAFFSRSVVDLTWSPCGSTLFAASIDGTVAYFHFAEGELGARVPEQEVRELLQANYGEAVGGVEGGTMAEDLGLVRLEGEAGHAQSPKAAGALAPPPPAQERSPQQLAGRGVVTTPNRLKRAAPVVATQLETRGADGRRRINPVALNGPPVGGGSSRMQVAAPPGVPAANGLPSAPRPVPVAGAAVAARMAGPPAGVATQPAGAFQAPAPAPAPVGLVPVVLPPPVLPAPEARRILVHQVSAGSPGEEPTTVEAINRGLGEGGSGPAGSTGCSVVCRTGDKEQWQDLIPDRVALLAGSERFTAAATSTGYLHVYSTSGRRILPPMCVGAAVAFLSGGAATRRRAARRSTLTGAAPKVSGAAAREALQWQLLLVTTAGHLYHWDLRQRACLLRADLAPLCAAEGDAAVLGVRLSDGGVPVVLLSNRNALAYNEALQCWLRVADGAHMLSDFASSLVANAGGASGELEEMNAAATASAASRSASLRFLSASPLEHRRATQRHLEFLLAASEALDLEPERRRWVGQYARHLVSEGDAARLQELCQELLGPVSSEAQPQSTAEAAPERGSAQHDLLRKVVLPAMVGANRAMQRVAGQFLDILESRAGA